MLDLSKTTLELKPGKTRIVQILEEYERNQPGLKFLGFIVGQY